MTDRTRTEEAGCASFETTLGLMDGTLSASARVTAQGHAASCGTCGPMVRRWAPMSDALREHLDSAAEAAKPSLVDLSWRVMGRIDGAQPARQAAGSWFSRLAAKLRPAQPYYVFAGAAAVAVLVAVPMVRTGPRGVTPVAVTPECDLDTDVHPQSPEVADEAGFHIHSLSFGAETGTVMTGGDDLPMIWVTENEGA